MDFPEWAVVGQSFRVGERLYHVRGLVDDQIIVRMWRPSAQYWHYEVFGPDWFDAFRNHIKPA